MLRMSEEPSKSHGRRVLPRAFADNTVVGGGPPLPMKMRHRAGVRPAFCESTAAGRTFAREIVLVSHVPINIKNINNIL